MGYAARFGRHDNAVGAPESVSREEFIQAQCFILLKHPADIIGPIVEGGEKLFVQRALWASNPQNFTRAEWEEVFRRISKGTHLPQGADPMTATVQRMERPDRG